MAKKMSEPKIFTENLARLKNISDLNKTSFSEALESSESGVQKYIAGGVYNPGIYLYENIAEKFHITPNEMLYENADVIEELYYERKDWMVKSPKDLYNKIKGKK